MSDIVERLRGDHNPVTCRHTRSDEFVACGRGRCACLAEDVSDAANEIERLRDAIKRQAAAAKTGMDAATRISSVQLEQARIARAESSPDAIDSERNANAVLTGEVERLRAELAAAKREPDGRP